MNGILAILVDRGYQVHQVIAGDRIILEVGPAVVDLHLHLRCDKFKFVQDLNCKTLNDDHLWMVYLGLENVVELLPGHPVRWCQLVGLMV